MTRGGGGPNPADIPKIKIKIAGGQKSLRICDILCVEVRHHYLFYHICEDGGSPQQVIMTRGSMHDVEEQLAQYDFSRSHLSFIINIKHVSSITRNEAYLGQTRLPISRNYKRAFTEAFVKFHLERQKDMS